VELREIIGELEALNRTSEKDFLAVGAKLADFLLVSRQISSDLSALTDLFAPEQSRDALHGLKKMFERAQEMSTRLERTRGELAAIEKLPERIESAFSRIAETEHLFWQLCILTRVETAGLGYAGASFGDLADEVKPLSEAIHESAREVLLASERLTASTRSAMRIGTEQAAVQMGELHTLIDGVVESMESFREQQRRAWEDSEKQTARQSALSDAMSGVVRSLQFHDITRQHVEHVSQALRQVANDLAREGRRASVALRARDALRLQSRQLHAAGEVFARSVEDMENELVAIAGKVHEMAETSRTLLDLSGGESESFFGHMEKRLTGIVRALENCGRSEAAIRSTRAELDRMLQVMERSVAGIRGIEIHIQRIALNASVQAAHIGETGGALNIISGVMHRLALDSEQTTAEAAASMDSIGERLHRPGTVPEGAAAAATDGGSGSLSDMRRAVLNLHTASEQAFTRLTQIHHLSERLGQGIASLIAGFSAGQRAAEVVKRCCAVLDGLAGSPSAETVSTEAPAGDIDRFFGNYTIQTERDVHRAVTGGGGLPPVAGACTGEGSDLGDNVELF